MQDRYVGDIGDFAKFGLLRYILSGLPQLKLGVQWYKVPDEAHNNDGRHIDYLADRDEFRDCDRDLYRALATIVKAGKRTLSAVQESSILPSTTLYFDTPLSFKDVPSAKRPDFREEWLKRAFDTLHGADIIFLDPDNGLEVKGIDRHANKGPKFTFYDDLLPFAESGKSVIIYQHATRQGAFEDQLQRRLNMLRFKLDPHITQFAVVRFRRVSARAFIFAMTDAHARMLQERIEMFVTSEWGNHFTQQFDDLRNDSFMLEGKQFLAKLIDEGAMISAEDFGPYILAVCEMISPGVIFYTGIDADSQHDAHTIYCKHPEICSNGYQMKFSGPFCQTYWVTKIEEQVFDEQARDARRRFERWKQEKAEATKNGRVLLPDMLLREAKWFQEEYPDQNSYEAVVGNRQ